MAEPRRILLVEDEVALADTLRYNLEREGFVVSVVNNGTDALTRFEAHEPDLVILDLMLPGMGGLDVCRAIRATSDVPIIIVTAKDSEADKVAGLELGADDYVTKPFSVRELISRVRANLRRTGSAAAVAASVLEVGPVRVDRDRHEVQVRGSLVPMPPKEFELLTALMRRADRLATRDTLIGEVWGADYVGDTKTLDVHIKRLRQKIEEDPHRPVLLVTVRGLGYRFTAGLDTSSPRR